MKVMGQSMTEPLEPDDSQLMEFVIKNQGTKNQATTTPPPQSRKRSISPSIKKVCRICPSNSKSTSKSKSKSKASVKEQRRLARCKP